MTLPTNFPISTAQINTELRRSFNAPFNTNGTNERALAQKYTGPVKISDFLGRSLASIVDKGIMAVSTSTINIIGAKFGPTYAGRTIFLAFAIFSENSKQNITWGSGSIGGVTAGNGHTHHQITGNGHAVGATIVCAQPSGLSGDIVISLQASPLSGGNMCWWLVSIPDMITPITVSSSAENDTTSGTAGPLTTSVPINGVLIRVDACSFLSTTVPVVSYTGITLRDQLSTTASISGNQTRLGSLAFDIDLPAATSKTTDINTTISGLLAQSTCSYKGS